MTDLATAVPDEPVAAPPGNEPLAEFGPAMRVLHTRWQRAVLALFQTRGNMTAALELAGYKSDNRHSLKATAWKIFHDDRVRAAVRETASADDRDHRAGIIGDHAWTLCAMLGPDARDRLMATRMIWDRATPVLNRTIR